MKPATEEASKNAATGQRPVATAGDAESSSLSSFDPTDVFPPTTVRAQLYREEPKLPRISVKGAELIGTTAALFLKDIVKRSAVLESITSAEKAGNDKAVDSGKLLRCANIYKAVEQTEAFLFLKEPLEGCGIHEMIQKERTYLTEYKPPTKRKRTPSASSSTAKKLLQSVKQSNDDFEEAPPKGVIDQIIADEDDYD